MTTPIMDQLPGPIRPPRWAEAVLGLLLPPVDAETVSGDLLEEYRESVRPSVGGRRADLWYVKQVTGFVWRAAWVWGLLLAMSSVGRAAFDWFVPPRDFTVRSLVSTVVAVAIFVAAGFWAAWRQRSVAGGVLAGITVAVIGAVFGAAGHGLLLAVWHDPQTLLAIQGSGGLGEVFVLPLFLIVPGALLATVGALAGRVVRLPFERRRVTETGH